jgi:hypothetical protein
MNPQHKSQRAGVVGFSFLSFDAYPSITMQFLRIDGLKEIKFALTSLHMCEF